MELMIIFLLMLIIPIYASIKVNLSYKKYVKIDNEKKIEQNKNELITNVNRI